MIMPAVLSGTVTLLAGLIVLVWEAMARSAKRLECARLRDELVDAARLGELDVTQPRVLWLIDWFDRVATSGRLISSARHTTRRPESTSLTTSLVTALTPSEHLPVIGPSWPTGTLWPSSFWPEPPSTEPTPGSRLQDRALRYQRDQFRRRSRVAGVGRSTGRPAAPEPVLIPGPLLDANQPAVAATPPAVAPAVRPTPQTPQTPQTPEPVAPAGSAIAAPTESGARPVSTSTWAEPGVPSLEPVARWRPDAVVAPASAATSNSPLASNSVGNSPLASNSVGPDATISLQRAGSRTSVSIRPRRSESRRSAETRRSGKDTARSDPHRTSRVAAESAPHRSGKDIGGSESGRSGLRQSVRRVLVKPDPVDVTGHPKPPGGLMPVSGPIPLPALSPESGSRSGTGTGAGSKHAGRPEQIDLATAPGSPATVEQALPSRTAPGATTELKDQIFAVAGQHVR